MSTQYPGGFITKSPVTPTTTSAKGMWTLSEQAGWRKQSLWPTSPGAPTIGTATVAGGTSVSVTFTAPANTGSAAITSYTVTSSPGGLTGTGASSPITVSGLTSGTAYTFTVVATNGAGSSPPSAASNSVTPLAVGQQAFTTAGTFSWVAPSGVTSVSVVAVGGGAGGAYYWINSGSSCSNRFGGGGGGLGYINNYSVTPGNSYTVVVGAGGTGWYGSCSSPPSSVQGKDSYFVSKGTVSGWGATNRCGGLYNGSGGGYGGTGSYNNTYKAGGGGGGAGGYSGSGGNGGVSTFLTYPTAGSGGGGGGGDADFTNMGSGGGGVGLLGQGANGAAGTPTCVYVPGRQGGGGSGGNSGGSSYFYSNCCGSGYVRGAGGSYGGGGYGGCGSTSGAVGAVRIIWPGTTRSFPSTNTGNL
jgi:hypothetical protein